MGAECRLGEVEKALAGMDPPEGPCDTVEIDGNMEIVLWGWEVYVPALGLSLQEGILCQYDGEAGACLPELPVTTVRGEGQEGWLSYGQGGFLATLAGYLQGRMGWGQLGQLRCLVRTPGEGQHLGE